MEKILLLIIAFAGGFVLMSIELLFPRISQIWFGNLPEVWAIDIGMSLLYIAVGYYLGSKMLANKQINLTKTLSVLYVSAMAYLLTISFVYSSILDVLVNYSVELGTVLFSILFMLPLMGMLGMVGPLLVQRVSNFSYKNQTPSSLVFGTSTLGGAISMLVNGLYLIPYLGIHKTIYLLGGVLMLCFVFAQVTYFVGKQEAKD